MPREKHDFALTRRHDAERAVKRVLLMFFVIVSVFFFIVTALMLFALIAREAAGQSRPPSVECRTTPDRYPGSLTTGQKPDLLCSKAFGEGWTFAAARGGVLFSGNDAHAKDGAQAWCKHQAYTCKNWSSQHSSDDALTCAIARAAGSNRGMIGVNRRVRCSEKRPFWCCKTNPDGGLQ